MPAAPDRGLESERQDGQIMRAAGILAIANIIQRGMGLLREMVKAHLFGASPLLSAFQTAILIPNSLNELIVGGHVNSALVPIFSEYAWREDKEELWSLASIFLTVTTIILAIIIAIVELFTPRAAALIGAFNYTDIVLTETSLQLMRLATPAVLFMSVANVLSGLLFSLKRFTLPAFVGTIFNATIVIVALLRPDHVSSLVYGMLLGAVLQIVIQLPALRDATLRPNLNLSHPALKRIFWLYAPVLASIGVNLIAIGFAYNLATRTGDQSLTYMNYATTLYQFPIGLVVTALSVAILPTLSRQALHTDLSQFKQTLADGIRLTLALILPAAIGLLILAAPVITLLFERGQFTIEDTEITAQVLRLFMLGLPFAAVDQMLVFASYARQDTWRPALAGVISISVYSVTAWTLLDQLGLLSLMAADAVKHMVHTLIMIWTLRRQIGGLGGLGIAAVLLKTLAAAGVMGVAAYAIAALIDDQLSASRFITAATTTGIAGISGFALYAGIAKLFGISDLQKLGKIWRRSL